MKKKFTLLLLISVVALRGSSDQELFLRGNQFYEQKEYAQAFETYQKINKKGNAVWFNLGNCAFHLENYAHAFAYWKRARHYASVQELDAIAFNINVLETKLGKETHVSKLTQIIERFSAYFSLGQAQFLFLLSWFLLFLLCIVYNQRKRYGILVPLSLLSVIMGGLVVVKYNTAMHHYGIVLNDKVTLYAGPNDQKEQWCKIEHQHMVGWVPADKLMLV